MKHIYIFIVALLFSATGIVAQETKEPITINKDITVTTSDSSKDNDIQIHTVTTSEDIENDPELKKLLSDAVSEYHDDIEDLKDVISEFKEFKPFINGIVLIFIIIFLLPITIITLIYRYKNQKEKYRLMEAAIKSGQSIPEFSSKPFRKQAYNYFSIELYNKGVKQICIGIALFIFLWKVTTQFALGCAGLFIIALGVEKLLRYRKMNELEKMQKENEQQSINKSNDEQPQ